MHLLLVACPIDMCPEIFLVSKRKIINISKYWDTRTIHSALILIVEIKYVMNLWKENLLRVKGRGSHARSREKKKRKKGQRVEVSYSIPTSGWLGAMGLYRLTSRIRDVRRKSKSVRAKEEGERRHRLGAPRAIQKHSSTEIVHNRLCFVAYRSRNYARVWNSRVFLHTRAIARKIIVFTFPAFLSSEDESTAVVTICRNIARRIWSAWMSRTQ